MPAEWEPHEATWLTWPQRRSDWPGRFAPIPWVYGEIVRKLAGAELVRILVGSGTKEAEARRVLARVGADLGRVELLRFPTDRGWARDFGPIFVKDESGQVVIARFRFNAWAKYPDWKKDALVPARAAKALGVRPFPVVHGGREVVLEGGSIDVNGRGTILTTEECLLHPTIQVRNPGFVREDYAQVFAAALGAPHVVWLGRGIAGDDTHGHVDDLARFVGPRTIALCREEKPQDANYAALADNWERIQDARLEDGSKPEVVALPMPAPLVFAGQRLPASYANFYVGNETVLVPTFNDAKDRVALGVLSELFPDRTVLGIHAVDLVWGLGTLHCLSQQQPARS